MSDGVGWPTPRFLDGLDDRELAGILTRSTEGDREVETTVRAIVGAVRSEGAVALARYSKELDGVVPERSLLGPDDFTQALDGLDDTLRPALERAARNLRTVAEATRPDGALTIEVEPGLRVTERHEPLARVGCYVPGGRAAYPSSVLMAVIPAKVAGVPDVVVASPPGPNGRPPSAVLAACAIAGADACLVAGGAQAIAALAYGVEGVRAVDKIVGPGNRFVTEAKRQVFGQVDIDSPAGPTEVLILADASADPEWVTMDLVAQAEHGPDSRCLLVTPDGALADAVADRLPRVAGRATRSEIITAAIQDHGHVLVAKDRDAACAFARAYAPEHLQVMTEDPEQWADLAATAATTFLGHHAPVPAGDYLTGANHVLPTAGAARFAGPLSVHDFFVRRTRQSIDARAARALADDLATFARAEGLDAHAESMLARGAPTRKGGDAA